MLAWLIRLAVVVAFLLAWRAPSVSVLTRQSDAATVESYEAVYELAADGALVVTEQLVVDLPPGKRGIFRIFDTVDPRRSEVDHPVEVVSVTRDGVREPWVWSESAAGTRTMRIGDENLFIGPGEFTYRIVSRTVDALEPVEADGSTTAAWWWDVVGSGWSMPMESVTVKATLPAVPRSVECVQGVDTPCTARTEGAGFSVTTGPLDPFTPVTTRATFPPGALPVPPGSPTAPTTLLAVVAGLLAAAAGAALWFSTRERAPGFPVLFEPPAGVGPATGFRVLAEEDSTDDLQATLFELGGRGVVTLSSSGSDWVVERVGDPGAVTLTPEAQMVLDGLGLDGPGDRFTVADTVSSGSTITTTLGLLRAGVAAAAVPYLERSVVGTLGRLVAGAAAAAVVAAAGYWLFLDQRVWLPLLVGATVFALVTAGIAVDRSVSTRHSSAGRDLWSRIGGFARFLSTESSESRFDAAAHADWYPRYLGWATALGVADAWAKRFEAQGVDVSQVGYVHGVGPHGTFTSSDLRDSVASAISGASSAYAASVSSSSGGGFSGGSGGGGGGGGSW